MSMHWTRIASEHNGEITFRVVLGRAEVFVEGYGQSDEYLRQMWQDALDRLPATFRPAHVLMLGLAAGAAVNEVFRRFPACEITAVEWDPQMISLFQRFARPSRPISIIEGDAAVVLPQLTDTFDLILIDIFKGPVPSPHLLEDAFAQSLAAALAPGGICILNAFETEAFFDVFARHFSPLDTWRFDFNLLAAYQLPNE